MDTPQTRRSFYYSFRISSPDTVWIQPKHDSHSTTHLDSSNQIQTRYAPDTVAILFLIQIQLSTSKFRYAPNTDAFLALTPEVWFSPMQSPRKSSCHLFRSQFQSQIHFRHESHSATHTDLNPSYNFRYPPDTAVILLLIQNFKSKYSTDTP